MRDEAEIRGHRRTYIGSMPGRIVQALKKVEHAQSGDPAGRGRQAVACDFRGDPGSAALLEVLDPEQNHSFSDHYLEVEFDLSEIMFITTAQRDPYDPAGAPGPHGDHPSTRLPRNREGQDRAEAPAAQDAPTKRAHQLPTSRSARRRSRRSSSATPRESGVRNLERELSKILRKVAKSVATTGKTSTVKVSTKNLEKYLGTTYFTEKELPPKSRIGVATGLAWTSFGGDILRIEAAFMPGGGRLTLTGQLGDVMQESAQIALSYARSMARVLPLKKNFFNEIDVHVHVPEGAIPKDGPSAGVSIATCLVSNFFGIPIRRDVAMTGELTLKGEVLPVGGLAEKTVAALRAGIKEVIIPQGLCAGHQGTAQGSPRGTQDPHGRDPQGRAQGCTRRTAPARPAPLGQARDAAAGLLRVHREPARALAITHRGPRATCSPRGGVVRNTLCWRGPFLLPSLSRFQIRIAHKSSAIVRS